MPKPLTEETITGDVLHQWKVQEYERHERGLLWYLFMLVFGSLFIVYSIWTKDFLFSFIIILFGIILFLQAYQEPLQVIFAITELGIIIGSRFYDFSEFKYFYIIYQPQEVKTLFFEMKSIIHPLIHVALLDKNPVEIRKSLREYLVEDLEKEEEPLSHTLIRQLRIH